MNSTTSSAFDQILLLDAGSFQAIAATAGWELPSRECDVTSIHTVSMPAETMSRNAAWSSGGNGVVRPFDDCEVARELLAPRAVSS